MHPTTLLLELVKSNEHSSAGSKRSHFPNQSLTHNQARTEAL
jgi:hypothetical protein